MDRVSNVIIGNCAPTALFFPGVPNTEEWLPKLLDTDLLASDTNGWNILFWLTDLRHCKSRAEGAKAMRVRIFPLRVKHACYWLLVLSASFRVPCLPPFSFTPRPIGQSAGSRHPRYHACRPLFFHELLLGQSANHVWYLPPPPPPLSVMFYT